MIYLNWRKINILIESSRKIKWSSSSNTDMGQLIDLKDKESQRIQANLQVNYKKDKPNLVVTSP